MERIVIIGSGPQARIIPDIIAARNDMDLLGFVDVSDERRFLMEDSATFPVYGKEIFPNGLKAIFDKFSIFIANDSAIREGLIAQAKDADLPFVNIIHPSAIISPRSRLGIGIMISPGVIIGPGAVIGDHCIINSAATVDHDSTLSDNVILAPGVHLAGHVKVESGTSIGIGACCLPGVKIGANCIIGAGSVITKAIPENSVAAGVPAKVLRSREQT